MIKKLTKNFNFLENNNFKDSKHILNAINKIQDAEKFSNPDYQIQCISDALECILNEFIENHNLKIDNECKLHEKIKKIEETGKINSKFLFNIMHWIKNSRNYVTHKHNSDEELNTKITEYDVLERLKNLFEVIISLFSDRIEDLPKEFDRNSYNIGDPKNISIIVDEQERINQNGFEKTNNDLDVQKLTIKNLLSIKNSNLVVPIYQRRYEWNEENVDALFNDILLRKEDGQEHYFGTIAYKIINSRNHNITNRFDSIKIIDGQQRITTSLLFVCAARQIIIERKYVENINKIDWYNEIISQHIDSKSLGSYIYNPGGTSRENETFKKILNNFEAQPIEKLYLNEKSKYAINFKHIYNRMKKEFNNKSELEFFINIFLNKFKIATISFNDDTFSNKAEMEIFENLNSKGLELSISDLIKNHIFNYCKDEVLNLNENEITKKYNAMLETTKIDSKHLEEFYVKIAEISNESNKFFDKEVTKEKRQRFSIIKESLDKFLTIKKNDGLSSLKEYRNMISKIENYMFIYMEMIQINNRKLINFIKCEKIINIVSDNKKKPLFIYYLFLTYKMIQTKYDNKFDFHKEYQDFSINKNEERAFQNLFLELTKFIIKTKVITRQGDSNIKRLLSKIASNFYRKIDAYKQNENIIEIICKEIIDQIFEESQKNNYSITEFKTALKNNVNHSPILDLLILTECIMSESLYKGGETIVRDKGNKSIEHILPKDSTKWSEEIKDSNERKKFIEECDNYKEKIGNYLILTTVKNTKAKNHVFEKKQNEVYVNLLSPLYKSKNNDIDVSNKKEWTSELIEKRTNALIEYILDNVITK